MTKEDDKAKSGLLSLTKGNRPNFKVISAEVTNTWGDELDYDDLGPRGFEVSWVSKSAGFGSINISTDKKGKISIDSEGMSQDFCLNVFRALLSEAFSEE